jgi:hypothetical protein
MERFREHEKEFKMKQYSKRALQADFDNKGNFVGDSGDEYDDSDYNNESGSYQDSEDEDDDNNGHDGEDTPEIE